MISQPRPPKPRCVFCGRFIRCNRRNQLLDFCGPECAKRAGFFWNRGGYVPTRERIATACQEVQQGWTESERLIRKFGTTRLNALMIEQHWTVPELHDNRTDHKPKPLPE